MGFQKYQSVERFGTEEVLEINNGKCYIFPKLDGTNGTVWFEDGEVQAGSRNRHLNQSPDGDNAGFCSAICEDKNIKRFLEDNPTMRLFGEWLVPHAIKDYKDDAWNKFYIFEVLDDNRYLSYEEYLPLLKKYELHYIPCIQEVNNPTSEELWEICRSNNYLMKEENRVGEGIVIKNYDFLNKYKRMVWAKMVNEEYNINTLREKKRSLKKDKKTSVSTGVERDIIDKYCKSAFIKKEFAKLTLNQEWDTSRLGELMKHIWYEFLREESVKFVIYFKNPTIDFKILNKLLMKKVRKTLNL